MLAADAWPDVGLGHLSRSSAVAAALRARGVSLDALAIGAVGPIDRDGVAWRPVGPLDARGFGASGVIRSVDAADAPDGTPVVVLDSYRTPRAPSEALGRRTALVVMHDEGSPPAGAALIVDPAANLRMACLRPAFWGLPPRVVRQRVERVLVVTGGGDPGGRALPLAEAARDALPDASVALVRGPQAPGDAPAGVEIVRSPPSLLDELLHADLVVSGGGQTVLEAAACGTPCVAVPLAPNQQRQVDALVGAGAAVTDISALGALAGDRDARATMAAAAQQAVDGYGALRVAYAIERLITGAPPPGA